MIQSGPGYQHRTFENLSDFQALAQQEFRHWPAAVTRGLKKLAVAGLLEPLSDEPIPPERIEVRDANCRETLAVDGVVSRHRAELLVIRKLIDEGELPPFTTMRLFLTEAVTPFADYLRQRCPQVRCSEYLPNPQHPLRGHVPHRDLRSLGLAPASMHCLICNEVLEHVEELEPSLEAMGSSLCLGGYLLATVPLAYDSIDSIVKARWRGEDQEPELLMEPEWHGDPVGETDRSLVYRIPGWELLDQLKAAGFRQASIHAVSSERYGVLGAELPIVFVVVAKR